jgi:hypothetical protein
MRMIQESFLVHRSLLFTERWLCERGARAQTRGSNYRRVLLVDDVPVNRYVRTREQCALFSRHQKALNTTW